MILFGACSIKTVVRPRPISQVLYDANDLLTHAVCVGMTGSGKTGFAFR